MIYYQFPPKTETHAEHLSLDVYHEEVGENIYAKKL